MKLKIKALEICRTKCMSWVYKSWWKREVSKNQWAVLKDGSLNDITDNYKWNGKTKYVWSKIKETIIKAKVSKPTTG